MNLIKNNEYKLYINFVLKNNRIARDMAKKEINTASDLLKAA